MNKLTHKVKASHTLNRARKNSIITANQPPEPSFVSFDSNIAEDISTLTASQSTLVSDIVHVDEDEDGSSTGSKVASISLPFATARAALDEEDEGSKIASTIERDWSCEGCTYSHCGKDFEFLTCKMCCTARPNIETQLRAARHSKRIKL